MTVYSDYDSIKEVCSVLSNETRLRLLTELHKMGGGTLREIHEKTTSVTGLTHRETTYKYLEQFVDVSLLEKGVNEDDDVEYQPTDTEVVLRLIHA